VNQKSLNPTKPYQALLLVLTGLQVVLLLPLRIKANVVHAGLSLQLALLKVLTKLHLDPFYLSQNSNLSIALRPAKDAMEAGNHVPLFTTKATTLTANQAILTLQLMAPVNIQAQHQ
jgi:hypothetical protein